MNGGGHPCGRRGGVLWVGAECLSQPSAPVAFTPTPQPALTGFTFRHSQAVKFTLPTFTLPQNRAQRRGTPTQNATKFGKPEVPTSKPAPLKPGNVRWCAITRCEHHSGYFGGAYQYPVPTQVSLFSGCMAWMSHLPRLHPQLCFDPPKCLLPSQPSQLRVLPPGGHLPASSWQ